MPAPQGPCERCKKPRASRSRAKVVSSYLSNDVGPRPRSVSVLRNAAQADIEAGSVCCHSQLHRARAERTAGSRNARSVRWMRVAFATCSLVADGWPDDREAASLLDADFRSWDDADVNWGCYDRVVLRSVFSYHEGFQNAGSCCGAVVFVDQSAESVAALNLSVSRWLVRVCRVGREQRESAVRALAVVVGGVDAEHSFEVAAADDQ